MPWKTRQYQEESNRLKPFILGRGSFTHSTWQYLLYTIKHRISRGFYIFGTSHNFGCWLIKTKIMHRAQESRYSILLTHSLLRFLVYKQPSPTFFLKRYVFELPLLTFWFLCDIILKPRGRGGIGRRARLRIWWLSVQVQVLSPAPNEEDMPLWRALFVL